MTQRRSRVTVLLSVFNGAEFIADAIQSILDQTYSDFTFVIYDDGSTDDTLRIIKGFGDPRIELRANAVNQGLAANLADGVRRAQGDFIARMDADDVAFRDRFERQIAFLDANPSVDVLGTSVVFFSGASETIGIQPRDHCDIAISLFFNFTMMHPTVVLRTVALRASDFNYDPAFNGAEDFDLWARMIRSRRFHNLQVPLLRMREHGDKVSVAKREEVRRVANKVRARQLLELGVSLEPQDAKIFFGAAWADPVDTAADLARLEKVLLRIIEANKWARVFDQPKLENYAASFFRESCRQALMRGNASGAAFWRSELRRHERLGAREIGGMAWRTTCALVGARADGGSRSGQ